MQFQSKCASGPNEKFKLSKKLNFGLNATCFICEGTAEYHSCSRSSYSSTDLTVKRLPKPSAKMLKIGNCSNFPEFLKLFTRCHYQMGSVNIFKTDTFSLAIFSATSKQIFLNAENRTRKRWVSNKNATSVLCSEPKFSIKMFHDSVSEFQYLNDYSRRDKLQKKIICRTIGCQ